MTKPHFATTFPTLDAHPTSDVRIYQTPWQRNTKYPDVDAQKTKQYFCCIVGGSESGNNCYGVTITRGMGIRAVEECEQAFGKVQEAADYYEQHNAWPQNQPKQSTQEDAPPTTDPTS